MRREPVLGIPTGPTGYNTNFPANTSTNAEIVDGTPIPTPSVDSTPMSTPFKARAAGFVGAMIAVGGVGGMIYGLALLAIYMNQAFKTNKLGDLSVGNPMCFDNDAPALLSAITCSQKKCTDLSTLSATQNWVNNHPFDLANIDPSQVYNTCVQYLQQCASGSGFLKTINPGQDSEFLADCDHTLTNVGTGFGWFGFALLSILSIAVSYQLVKGAYHCMSALFSDSDSNDSDYTPTLNGESDRDPSESERGYQAI